MMRCSSRDPEILHPAFFTSTPLPRKRLTVSHWASGLSPITEAASTRKLSLANGVSRRKPGYLAAMRPYNTTVQKQRSFAPLVIASSDSEEEPIPTIKMPSLRLSKNTSKGENNKSSVAKQKRPARLKERPVNFLEEISGDFKRRRRRVSKIDAVLEQIVKESINQPDLSFSSAERKALSESGVDALVEKVIMNSGNDIIATKPARRKVRSKALTSAKDDKENLVRRIVNGSNVVDIFVNKQKPQNIKLEVKNIKPLPSDPLKMRITNNEQVNQSASEDKAAVICKLSEAEWKQINSYPGVSVSEKLSVGNSTNSYIKLDAKCSFRETSSYNQLVIITEGLGTIIINDSKMNVGPGDRVKVPTGCEYEFLNRGVKKPLIMSVTQFGTRIF